MYFTNIFRICLFSVIFSGFFYDVWSYNETPSQVNVAGGIITMSTQGAFDADGADGSIGDGLLYFNLRASNSADSTVAPGLSSLHSGTPILNGVDWEFNPFLDGLLITSTKGASTNFNIGITFVGTDINQDFLHEMFDSTNNTYLDVVGLNGHPVYDINNDDTDNDVSFEVLAENVVPDGRIGSTLTQDNINSTNGFSCIPDLDLGLDVQDSSRFKSVSAIASGEEPSSDFYFYRSFNDINSNGLLDVGESDIVGDNGCNEFSIDLFPLIELNPNFEGIAAGIYSGVFVFDLTIL